MAKITVEANQCDACGHVWLPSGKIAVQCAKCRSRKWDHLAVERERTRGSLAATPVGQPIEVKIPERWKNLAERTVEYEE